MVINNKQEFLQWLNKLDKTGLSMIALGVVVCFLGLLWTPLVIVGIGLIIIGVLLWSPLDLI